MTTPVYAVTGASGRLGRLAVEQLTARGVPPADIVALVRTPAKAVSLAASIPAQAAVFAQFTQDSGNSDFKWVQSTPTTTGGDLFSITSNGAASAQGVATHFSFLDPALGP